MDSGFRALQAFPAADPGSTHGKSAVLWVVDEKGEPKPLSSELGEADESDVAVVGGALAKGDSVIIGEVAKSAPKQLFGIRVGL